MKIIIIFLALTTLLWPLTSVVATSNSHALQKMHVDLSDIDSLQRGARIFVNYCMGCHSAAYMRYNRIGQDIDIDETVLKSNLMFNTDKTSDTMTIAIDNVDAKQFFGVVPPDLSVIARSRGANWLYTYFMTFYRDESSPVGFNNLAFKDVAMPHVLWELQGIQEPVYKTIFDENTGQYTEAIASLELVEPGLLDKNAYRSTVHDLVNFLVYLGEPAQMKRKRIGVIVIAYLLVLLLIVFLMKREFWKDIH